MKGLPGKTALLAGASSGIGQAIAIRLAQESCNIAIYCNIAEEAKRTEEIALQQYTGESGKESGVQSLIVQGDVSKENDIIPVVDSVIKKIGSLDILINSAEIQMELPSHEVPTK